MSLTRHGERLLAEADGTRVLSLFYTRLILRPDGSLELQPTSGQPGDERWVEDPALIAERCP
jgi:hypothetical protein